MTIKEAIRILDPETTKEALQSYDYNARERRRVVDEACQIAVDELRKWQWVSVKDKLPNYELYKAINEGKISTDFEGVPQIEVLVTITGAVSPAILWYDGTEFYDDEFEPYEVTHWMPLPPVACRESRGEA